MSIRERNINFNPTVAFLKPRNEGIAECIRLLASELQKGLSFKWVRGEKYRPENRSNPPFCFAMRSGKRPPFYPLMPTKYYARNIFLVLWFPRPYALVSGFTTIPKSHSMRKRIPELKMGIMANCQGNLTKCWGGYQRWTSIPSRGVAILLIALCYGNQS